MSFRPRIVVGLICAFFLASPIASFGQSEPISLELIMSDPLWMGKTPRGAYWSVDGKAVYFSLPVEDESFDELIRLKLEGGQVDSIEGELWGSIDVRNQAFSPNRDRAVFERAGDLFLRDVATGDLRQLTRTVGRESSPIFMADGERIAFERDGELFVRTLKTGFEEQVADIRTEDDPDEKETEPSFLDLQQERLFDVVRERQGRAEREEDWREARQEADPTAPPPPVYLGKKKRVLRQSVSPGGSSLALVIAPEGRDEGQGDRMPNYVSDDGYVEVRDVRPKVGTAEPPDHGLVFVDLKDQTFRGLDLSGLPTILDDPLEELKKAAAEKKAAEKAAEEKSSGEDAETEGEEKPSRDGKTEKGDTEKEPTPRSVQIETMAWSPSGQNLAIQIHSYDNKDRWTAVSRGGGDLETVHHLHIDAWINWNFNQLGWLSDDLLWFLSEQSGWSQLYVHDLVKGQTRRLTDTRAVVSNPTPSPDNAYIYFTANPEHPGQYDTYRVSVAGGETEKISHLGGRTHYELSPDGRLALLAHSSLTRPTELYLLKIDGNRKEPKQLTQTVSPRFTALPWVEPEIVGVPSTHHDRPIYSRFYPARNPDRLRGPDGRVPAVLFVHGAGYLQNAHKGFSTYFREFMFHTFLSEQGYHVLDMDYRASAGYGADWRTAIYRQMGTPELEDLKDGLQWLIERQDVDPQRAGIYGGSYGGFMTMMALFKEPDLFAAGAALRPVTDWAHYNHPYTSNILNTPDVDPEAYRISSPIEFADGLKNPLLICAPMLDDNVFFQDTVRLAQKFIELGNTQFEVALYPVEPHGFRRPSSWLDEYRRIYRLFEQNLTP